MIRKLFICPYFGDLPPWFDRYLKDVERLRQHGYDWLIDDDLERFKQRCRDRLNVTCRIEPGTGKIHDYRAALAILYRDEIAGYDYWGHTDFDIAYGNPANFVTDELLDSCDLHTDGWNYVNGPWTLCRHSPDVNTLFADHDGWREILESTQTFGWVETTYSDVVKKALGDRFVRTHWQTRNLDDFGAVRFDGERLFEGEREVIFAHFRRTKQYPPQLLEAV